MLNRGPAKWREWRFGNQVLPLYLPDPKALPKEGEKPLSEVAHLSITALKSKGALPSLTEAIEGLVKAPDSPGGRVQEDRFRATLKKVVAAVLAPDEMEDIFPSPVLEMSGTGSRRPSKNSRKPSKEPTGA
mmetsp:Transcript_72318/g.233710  ORF Transcript_72318/g.233710 Transcript_72318/m.233710 type:complete len:131 (+) Transcript_72318:188-580(+)